MPESEKELSPVSVELMQAFLANQAKELELNEKNLELLKQQDSNNYNLAKKSLDIQEKDLANERQHKLEIGKMLFNLSISAVFVLAFVVIVALYLDKEQFVLELAKIAMYGGGGVAVGAFYQKGKRQSESKE